MEDFNAVCNPKEDRKNNNMFTEAEILLLAWLDDNLIDAHWWELLERSLDTLEQFTCSDKTKASRIDLIWILSELTMDILKYKITNYSSTLTTTYSPLT